MGNIIDYIKWRGDLTFAERPFHDVDNAVLSALAYVDLSKCGITQNGKTIKAVAEVYKKQEVEDSMGMQKVLFAMGDAIRYKNLVIHNYVDIWDEKIQTQFAAMTIRLDDHFEYIAFRGTDNSIVGWREDFMISFQETNAQKMAVSYLNYMIKEHCEYRIGGHSKGGNLAIYAALCCEEEKKKNIKTIYSNDGPGICPEMLNTSAFLSIQEKIRKIVPEYCVIGMLFENTLPTKIVKTSVDGLLSHDILAWQVEGSEFCCTNVLSEQCKRLNQIIDRWIESSSLKERKSFTVEFFDAMEACGAKEFKQISEGGADGIEKILIRMSKSEKETKHVVGKFLESLLQGFVSVDYIKLVQNKNIIISFILLVIGIIFVSIPEASLHVVGSVFFLGILGYGVYRTVKTYRNYQGMKIMKVDQEDQINMERTRMIFYAVITVIGMICVVTQQVVIVSTNLIMGILFGWQAYSLLKVSAQLRTNKQRLWTLILVESIVAFSLGIVAVALAGTMKPEYLMVAGSYLTIENAINIGRLIYAQTEYV